MGVVLRRLASCLAAAALLWASAVVPARADEQPVATSAWDGTCTDALFVGSRGSGEGVPYGPTVTRARDLLLPALGEGVTVAQVYVDYPAASPYSLSEISPEVLLLADEIPENAYVSSVADGVRELRRFLREVHERCPRTAVAVVGFSQGSEVVTGAMVDPQAAAAVTTGVVVGDPSATPGRAVQPAPNSPKGAVGLSASLTYLREAAIEGRSDEDPRGLRAALKAVLTLNDHKPDGALLARALQRVGLVLPAGTYPVLRSVCQSGDLVCDAGSPLSRVILKASTLTEELNKTRPVHSGYTSQILAPTMRQAAAQWAPVAAEARTARIKQAQASAQPQPAQPSPREWVYPAFVVATGLVLLLVGFTIGRLTSSQRPVRARARKSASAPDWPSRTPLPTVSEAAVGVSETGRNHERTAASETSRR